MREIQEDEVLFEKIDEDHMLVAIASTNFSQSNIPNISLLNEWVAEEESENRKLKDEIIDLKE